MTVFAAVAFLYLLIAVVVLIAGLIDLREVRYERRLFLRNVIAVAVGWPLVAVAVLLGIIGILLWGEE